LEKKKLKERCQKKSKVESFDFNHNQYHVVSVISRLFAFSSTELVSIAGAPEAHVMGGSWMG